MAQDTGNLLRTLRNPNGMQVAISPLRGIIQRPGEIYKSTTIYRFSTIRTTT
jgi:hypothetical protein